MDHPILRDKAYALIKQRILELQFKPGERLREDSIADEISMSRTPVREAINQLATEGLVVNVPRKGLFCASVSREEFLDFLRIREALETIAVQCCVERITEAEIDRLAAILDDYETALTAGDLKTASALDTHFHKSIAECSRNRKLIRFISEIEDFMRLARSKERPDLGPAEKALSIAQHRAILRCIRERDEVAAADAIRENIRGMRKKLGL
ncbi:MAG: GntR family transcriptional regulator [Rhodoplanes sp.]|uniref:GntR family transcriptional regulator n=1 Tax=Rhodoplanes sp. TaxID=1968906 RepID=UPI0018494A9B|nr:GntR family transcriptional regulator [Rhodoplanes sp.]NVO12627.1 GntR family transcriptional regulator [Rhodoplanes sp.]